jgi:hypothetical protein
MNINWRRSAWICGYELKINTPRNLSSEWEEDHLWQWMIYDFYGKYIDGCFVDTEQEALDACQKWVDENIKE